MINLLSLLQLSDPALPVGGYAHSAGLETYVQKGIVYNRSSATAFIAGMLEKSLKHTDGAFMSLAYDAAGNEDYNAILKLDEACSAVKLASEMRLASKKLGIRLIKIFEPVCKNALTAKYKTAIETNIIEGNYCIAFGLYASALNIEKAEALTGFYYNAAAGMTTNSVKLIPLGQQDGQEILFSLQPLIIKIVQESMRPDINQLGLCCPGFDVRCMQHEQLYSRLYMS